MVEVEEQRAIGRMIQRHIVEPLMAGRFSAAETVLLGMAVAMCHIERNIEQTCMILGGCDPKTLKRWEADKSLGFPAHHKDPGGKQYYWLDEVEAWKSGHAEVISRVEQKRKSKLF